MKISKILILSALLLASIPTAQSFAVSALFVDRNPVSEGEFFQIQVFVDGEVDPDEKPDFSDLPEAIRVVDLSRYEELSSVNGVSKRINKWVVRAKAEKAGKYLIPSIEIGGDVTEPVEFEILAAANTEAVDKSATLLELTANSDQDSVYVQEQIIYTVKLFRAVHTRRPYLTEPQAEKAIIEKLGEDRQYQIARNGVNFLVLERRYAIFPQQSGDLTITPVTFTADVPVSEEESRSSFSSLLSRTKPVKLSTSAIPIEVKPKPAEAEQPWLPANQLLLDQQWSEQNSDLVEGQPTTWTLLIKGVGLSESQLPDLAIPDTPGLNFYRDSAQTRRATTAKGFESFKMIKIALVPTQAGSVTLPELRLPWWNTQTDTQEYAVIPEQTIEVAPNPQAQSTLSNIKVSPSEPTIAVSQSFETGSVDKIWQVTTAIFAALWLATLGWWWQMRRRSIATTPSDSSRRTASTSNQDRALNSKKELVDACRNGNANLAKEHLLRWLSQQSSVKLHSLAELHARLEASEARAAVAKLQKHLYASDAEDSKKWDGKSLEKALSAMTLRSNAKQVSSTALPDLYDTPNRA